MKNYLVIAYYRGSTEKHSYPVYLGNNADTAKDIAERQCDYRGGKYSCVVYEIKEGSYNEDCQDSELSHIKKIYETKIPYSLL